MFSPQHITLISYKLVLIKCLNWENMESELNKMKGKLILNEGV